MNDGFSYTTSTNQDKNPTVDGTKKRANPVDVTSYPVNRKGLLTTRVNRPFEEPAKGVEPLTPALRKSDNQALSDTTKGLTPTQLPAYGVAYNGDTENVNDSTSLLIHGPIHKPVSNVTSLLKVLSDSPQESGEALRAGYISQPNHVEPVSTGLSSDLIEVVATWTSLAKPVQQAILAIIRAVSKQSTNEGAIR